MYKGMDVAVRHNPSVELLALRGIVAVGHTQAASRPSLPVELNQLGVVRHGEVQNPKLLEDLDKSCLVEEHQAVSS